MTKKTIYQIVIFDVVICFCSILLCMIHSEYISKLPTALWLRPYTVTLRLLDCSYQTQVLKPTLYSATLKDHVEIVKLLLSTNGIDINKATVYGITSLIEASRQNHLKVVELLLSNSDIDINRATTDKGFTALYSASQNNHVEEVRLLLSKKVVLILTQSHLVGSHH